MGEKELKNTEDKINGLISELAAIASTLRTQIVILEKADMELGEASDQFDAELGFWDTVPEKHVNISPEELETIWC